MAVFSAGRKRKSKVWMTDGSKVNGVEVKTNQSWYRSPLRLELKRRKRELEQGVK